MEYRGIKSEEISYCWANVSFDPERRAEQALESLKNGIEAFEKDVTALAARIGDKAEAAIDVEAEVTLFADRHTNLARQMWQAQSRCASSFIVGPSNFPVSRARAANETYFARLTEYTDHKEKALNAVMRHAFPHGDPDIAIRSDHPDAVRLLKEKIAEIEEFIDRAKRINKAYRALRDHPTTAATKKAYDALSDRDRHALEVFQNDHEPYRHQPVECFTLTNRRAKLKTAQARLKQVEAVAAQASECPKKTIMETSDGVKLVEEADDFRIRVYFDGKPPRHVIAQIKSEGFRWSPKAGAWQRLLNNAGRYHGRIFMEWYFHEGTATDREASNA